MAVDERIGKANKIAESIMAMCLEYAKTLNQVTHIEINVNPFVEERPIDMVLIKRIYINSTRDK